MNTEGDSENKIDVGVAKIKKAVYPNNCPYHPSVDYPEYPFGDEFLGEENYVYEGVRDLFLQLGFDVSNYGNKNWNPLGRLIEPGMKVVIKPNFVLSRHSEGKDLYAIITHPSVLRAIIDYCWIALKGHGQIIIADAPQYNCDFNELLKVTKLDAMIEFYSRFSGPEVKFYDLRNYWSKGRHFPSLIRKLPGDPQGVVRINLGKRSALYNHPHPERFYGAVYHRHETIESHSGETQEYEISQTVLSADVFISVPKMKVHKKVGVTLNLKGLVGMCTNKNLIVHYTLGSPEEGGDQYPEGLFSPLEQRLINTERWMYDHLLATRKIYLEYLHRLIYWLHGILLKPIGIIVRKDKRLFDAGNWYGNNSAWRMAVDLLKIIYFADHNGQLHNQPCRRLFSIVDGVIAGENNGPLVPDAKLTGIILGGDNFLAVDLVATRLMGFDYQKIKLFSIINNPEFNFGLKNIKDIGVISDDESINRCLSDRSNSYFAFKPHPGWVEHIEI